MSIGLKLTDAKISFGDEIVLDRLNLSVPAGESTAIIGPAASGKSVLFKYILNLLDGHEPNIKFLNISSPLIRFFVAYTFSSLLGILMRKETFKAAFAPEAICDDFSIKGGRDFALSSEAFLSTSEDLIFAQSSAPSLVGREKELEVYTEVLFGEDDEILDAKLHGEKFCQLSGYKLSREWSR